MNNKEKPDSNTNTILKPELAFSWVKYIQKEAENEVYQTDKADSLFSEEKTVKISESTTTKSTLFRREQFKNQPIKEKLFLWYQAIFTKKEMSIEEFSTTIEMKGIMETEEFLFRHAPLKYAYIWRGKNLKFDAETIQKLEEELKKE